jgi:hypothetical protein
MKNRKHTPGPWAVHPRIKDSVVTGKGGSIADLVGTKSAQEHEANARLIAAAPEMLEVLELLESRWDEIVADDVSVTGSIHMIRAAIAKARGEV